VAGVEQGEQVGQDGRVLAARRGDGDDVAGGEEAAGRDGGVDFLLQGGIEAGLAELCVCG